MPAPEPFVGPHPSSETALSAKALTPLALQRIRSKIPADVDGINFSRIGLTPGEVQVIAFIHAVSRDELERFDLRSCDDMKNAELRAILKKFEALLRLCEKSPDKQDITSVWDLYTKALEAARAQAKNR